MRILSNTYENNKGVVTCEGDLTVLDGVFSYSEKLKTISLPNSITKITIDPDRDYSALQNCANLEMITLGTGLLEIEGECFTANNPFYGCVNLTKINIRDLHSWLSIANSDILVTGGTRIIGSVGPLKSLLINNEVVSSIQVPSTITSIKAYSLCFNSTMEVSLHDNVQTVEQYAFASLEPKNLNLIVGSGVAYIGMGAIYACHAEITYNGTQAQWEAIEKDPNWSAGGYVIAIHCTDGDIQL